MLKQKNYRNNKETVKKMANSDKKKEKKLNKKIQKKTKLVFFF